MKFKLKDKTIAHKWFAWRPVVINNTLIWLEFVNRKQTSLVDFFGHQHSYSLIENHENT